MAILKFKDSASRTQIHMHRNESTHCLSTNHSLYQYFVYSISKTKKS